MLDLRDVEIVNVPFLVVLGGDAVLGVSSAVWQATQTRHNDAMRPPVPSKNGIFAVSASLSIVRKNHRLKRYAAKSSLEISFDGTSL